MRKYEKSGGGDTYKKLVIWALYDDAYCSYRKAVKKYFKNNNPKIEIHSFGINDIKSYENYFYHKVDLSLSNLHLISQLNTIAKEYQKPDIILASPPCESWSGADCGGKMIKSIGKDGKWEIQNRKYYEEYNKTCHPVKRRYFLQKEQGRILGEATIGGTIQIIEYFQPRIWIIENPQTSKTWDFQKNHWNFQGVNIFENLAYYSAYDANFSPKPTIFKGNIKLNLKNKRVPGNNDHMAKGSYAKRSAIPLLLIEDLLTQILHYLRFKDED